MHYQVCPEKQASKQSQTFLYFCLFKGNAGIDSECRKVTRWNVEVSY